LEIVMSSKGPLLRIFEVRTKAGCAAKLLENFATTSAKVVKGKAGNNGYFFGHCVHGGDNVVMFVSVWDHLDAVKARFGKDWQVSYMPEGYEDLIEECSVRHFDMSSGWHVEGY
jgi:hypothetical protein